MRRLLMIPPVARALSTRAYPQAPRAAVAVVAPRGHDAAEVRARPPFQAAGSGTLVLARRRHRRRRGHHGRGET